jgi:hypothetical protein
VCVGLGAGTRRQVPHVGWRWCSHGEARGAVGVRARWARGVGATGVVRRGGSEAGVAALGLTR